MSDLVPRNPLSPFGFLVSLFLLGACASTGSYNDQVAFAFAKYAAGDTAGAAQAITSAEADEWVDKKTTELGMTYGDDAVPFLLERGKMLRDAQRFEESNEAFTEAENIIVTYDNQAIVAGTKAVDELMALASNQKSRPYKGYTHDKILLRTFEALNYLSLGDLDNAAVYARRAITEQESATAEFPDPEPSPKSEAALAQDASFVDLQPDFSAVPQEHRSFLNPYATLVIGLVRRIAGFAGESAEVDFQNLTSMLPGNKFVAEELARIKAGESASGSVYVLFENGLGPWRSSTELFVPTGLLVELFERIQKGSKEHKFDPTNLLRRAVLAFPTVQGGKTTMPLRAVPSPRNPELETYVGTPVPTAIALEVSAGGFTSKTELVSDMDLIVNYEFNQRWAGVVIRELMSAVAKEVIDHLAKSGFDELTKDGAGKTNPVLDFFWGLFGTVTKAVLAQADDRAWKSVGANFQAARLSRPEDNNLSLSVGGASQEVSLPKGDVVVVMVRSIHEGHLDAHAVAFGNTVGTSPQ